MPIQYSADRSNGSKDQPTRAENGAPRKKMMADMTIKPPTDADRDFVAMMVPHPRVGARSQRDVRAVKHKHSAYDGTRHGRSEPLKHVGRNSLSVRLAIRAGPNAIHLISL